MDPAFLLSMAKVEDAHWWFRARRELVAGRMRAHLPSDAARLLDIGSGTGGNLAHFSREFPSLACVGLEPDDGARSVCKSKGLDVRDGDAAALKHEDASFDVVTMLDVLEHLDDDRAGARELARVLAPGGLLVLTVPALPSLFGPHDRITHHRRRYLRKTLVPVIEAAGLSCVECSYFNSRLLPAAWVVRKAQRLTNSHPAEETLPPAPVNAVFYRVFRGEAATLANGGYRRGLSLLLLAEKRAD